MNGLQLSIPDARELGSKAHLGVWAENKRGFVNAPHHWEWSEIAMKAVRECIVAPREHAKSEVFTINNICWRSIYWPGFWSYAFANIRDQGVELLDRIRSAMWESEPWMMEGAYENTAEQIIFANWSRVSVGGAGKKVRGAHPDLIVGDDVLSDENTWTHYMRKKTERWWFGTVGGMSHPGTIRALGKYPGAPKVWFPATRVILVGTPFHQQDLLMGMRENPLYRFRRYAAEFDPRDLKGDSLAIEAA